MKEKAQLSQQVTLILKQGEKVLASESSDNRQKSSVDERGFHDFRIAGLSLLSRIFGEDSGYSQSFKAEVTQPTPSRTRRGMAILDSAQRDIEEDWLETTRGAITRDILTDILRLGSLQLSLKNVASAVVIGGTVLEKLLRDLCLHHSIAIHNQLKEGTAPKRGLQMCGDIYKKKIIERQDHKSISGWLELAEQAAAGKSKEITPDLAKKMLAGIQAFIAKHRF